MGDITTVRNDNKKRIWKGTLLFAIGFIFQGIRLFGTHILSYWNHAIILSVSQIVLIVYTLNLTVKWALFKAFEQPIIHI